MPVTLRTPLALVLALGVAVAGCSSGDDDEARPEPDISTSAVVVPEIALKLSGSELVSPHQPLAPLPAAHRARALATVQAVFDTTVVRPLVKGREPSLAGLFTPDAAARASGPDRGVLFEAHLSPVASLKAEKANVRLTGLAGTLSNDPDVVLAKIDWLVQSIDGALRIHRQGELGLIPGGERGWRVASYTVTTTRSDGREATTTTASTAAPGEDR